MLQLICLLYAFIVMLPINGFGRGLGLQVKGATGFGPNLSRMRASERAAGADMNKVMRAPRSDVLNMPQIACSSDAALLAEIKQCVCQLKNLVETCACSQSEQILSEVEFIATKVEAIFIVLSSITNLDVFISEFDILVSSLDTLNIGALTSLTDSVIALNSSLDGISSRIDVDINIDQTILSVVDKINTQLDVIGSSIAKQENCCSTIGLISSVVDEIATSNTTIVSVIDKISTQVDSVGSLISNITVSCSNTDALVSIIDLVLERTKFIQSEVSMLSLDLSLLPVIDSKTDVVLFNVGSRTDFALSKTEQLSTIDIINSLDLTVIALLKTILADLHGL